MKRIVEVNPDGRGENYYEVFDESHANPQNTSGWAATLTKREMEAYIKCCGPHTIVPYVQNWKEAYRMMSKKEGKSADDAEREICNIQDMSKEDAVEFLVNELAGRIL